MTRQEIVQRAADQVARTDAQYQQTRTEILRQRHAALALVPGVAEALEAHERALAGATRAYQETVTRAQNDAATAEQNANDAIGREELAATDRWQRAVDLADSAQRAATAAATDAYNDACNAAMHVSLASRPARLTEAKTRRDDAIARADRACQDAKAAAWETYQEASNKARESAITSVSDARTEETTTAQAAAAAFENARAAAEAALQQAFFAAPVAGAIDETFNQRLQEAEAVRDRDKATAMERMKRELEQLTS
jgi:hypothetical protein